MSDSEYEYEYDDNETETFFVNIDLTSYNGPIRAPRSRQAAPDTTEAPSPPPSQQQQQQQQNTSPERQHRHQQQQPSQPEDPTSNGNDGFENRVQIMELHGDNPLVSYGNQIYSCEWADMIGTDMHFTRREEEEHDQEDRDNIGDTTSNSSRNADSSFLKHGTNYSLIAANRIKIIGRKVHLTSANPEQHGNLPSSSSAAAATAETETTQQEQTQQAAETSTITGKTAQVRFLQELMDIKRAKGEKDMVLSRKRGGRFDDKVTRWAQTEERLNMIHQLNRDALTGDVNAVKKLEDLYDTIDRADSNLAEPAPAPLASFAPQAGVGNAPSG